MSYSVKERSGGTTVGPDGTVVDEVVAALLWDDKIIGRVSFQRVIKPEDDITGDTSRAARLADTARKAGNEDVTVPVRVR